MYLLMSVLVITQLFKGNGKFKEKKEIKTENDEGGGATEEGSCYIQKARDFKKANSKLSSTSR